MRLDKQGKTFELKPQILQKRIADKKTSILNLSKKHKLTSDEISVLDFGLTFCPSVQHFNKEQFADDVYKFIRQLSLRIISVIKMEKVKSFKLHKNTRIVPKQSGP